MNDKSNSPACERSSDLMAFIYEEMTADEVRQFELHIRQCNSCREEAASFGLVRESIATWREEVLTGFVPSTATPTRRSAAAAFRQFFDLSPLWLKGAAAFAVLTFFVLVGLVFFTSSKKQEATAAKNDAIYNQQDVDRLVKEALAKQQQTIGEKAPTSFASVQPPTVNSPAPQRPASKQTAKNRRPLSRAEREQLAADLRLLSTDDDLDLLGDRINQ
jgi:hypothetical protein